jgi:hypothetical protein
MGEVQVGVLKLGQVDKHELINPLAGKTKAIGVTVRSSGRIYNNFGSILSY